MDTRNKDFYDYFVLKNPDDLLAKNIGKNDLFWSDLELGLGKYTANVKEGEEEVFWDSEELLEQELANYLEMQEGRVNLKDGARVAEMAEEMQRSVTEFYQELPKILQQKIDRAVYNITESVNYSFITFNYTNVFDRCIYLTKKSTLLGFGRHQCYNGISYPDFIDDVLHIHGTTREEMVLGVNDASQVMNVKFIKNNLYRQCLIKEEANRRFNPGKVDEAYRIIDESIIICVFGMSIGNTDKMWWEYICKWLSENEKRLLVIYATTGKSEKGYSNSKRALFTKADDINLRLKNNAEVSEETWEKVKDQIFVKCNAKMFRLNIIDEVKKS